MGTSLVQLCVFDNPVYFCVVLSAVYNHSLCWNTLLPPAVDVSVSREGIKIFGELPHINWGPLKLYRPTSKVVKIVEPAALALRRVDMIKSADDVKKLPPGTPPSPGGPVVYLELTPQKQVRSSLWFSSSCFSQMVFLELFPRGG